MNSISRGGYARPPFAAPTGDAAPVDCVIGPGALDALADVVVDVAERTGGQPERSDSRTGRQVMLLVSDHFADRSWAGDVLRATARAAPLQLAHSGTTTPRNVALLAEAIRAAEIGVVVAVGGGSVLDAAKAAARLAAAGVVDEDDVVAACEHGAGRSPSVPVVAVPSTPGTGAEVTPFATVWDVTRARKLSLADPQVAPAAAILDPLLLNDLTPASLLSGVLDTVCQGAEAIWSRRSTNRAIAAGLAALTLASGLLDRLEEPLSDADLLALQLAGNASGRAIASANTSSCHAISYALTLRLGLPHGHACGVSFGRLLRYNAAVRDDDCVDLRGPAQVRASVRRITQALGATDPRDVSTRIDRLLTQHGLARYDQLPVDPREVAEEALSYARCHDNPRRLDPETLADLLASSMRTEELCS